MHSRKKRSGDIPVTPIVTKKRSRQFRPVFFQMGPVALSVTSVILISLMAILYLSQSAQAVSANRQLHTIRSEQAKLQRQKQDLADSIAKKQSPEYIMEQAIKRGLVPADPEKIQIIQIPNLLPIKDATNQP